MDPGHVGTVRRANRLRVSRQRDFVVGMKSAVSRLAAQLLERANEAVHNDIDQAYARPIGAHAAVAWLFDVNFAPMYRTFQPSCVTFGKGVGISTFF